MKKSIYSHITQGLYIITIVFTNTSSNFSLPSIAPESKDMSKTNQPINLLKKPQFETSV